MNQEAGRLFAQLRIDIDPKETMSNLTVAKQQMCEIAKAISHDAISNNGCVYSIYINALTGELVPAE